MIRIILDDAMRDELRTLRLTDPPPKDRVRIEMAALSDAGRWVPNRAATRGEDHRGTISVHTRRPDGRGCARCRRCGCTAFPHRPLGQPRHPPGPGGHLRGDRCAILRRGPGRGAWLGFAVFGWAYFLMTLSPWGGEYGLGPARFLTRASTALLLQIDPDLVEMPVAGVEEFAVFAGTGKSRSYYHGIFHALTAVIFAAAGALVGRVVAASGDPEPSRPTTPGP